MRTVLADVLPPRRSPHLFYQRHPFSSSPIFRKAKIKRADKRESHPVKVNQYGAQKANAVARGKQYPRTALEMELRQLRDPLKLADHVRSLLKKNDEKKALELVRAASRNAECTVSWNHLMDYNMSKGKVNPAWKLYNEMKKRAQIPDAYTYTILFRGLADHAHFSQSLAKALSLYESMVAPNSKVKPSIKHMNAVLKVCARAKDLDAMWALAAKLPARGLGAPDNLTFTTILNAVNNDLSSLIDPKISEEERSRSIEKAVLHGRRMWDDIVGRWRKGDIWIDEELVCSMGRLLLVGKRPRDWDDILSLVEQTMAVPRLLPPLGTPEREDAPAPQIAAPNDAIFLKEEGADGEPEAGGEFDPIDISQISTHVRGGDQPAAYAQPGRNTLSLILAACLKMRTKKTGQAYWAHLTDPTGPHAISPDPDNYNAHMRLLRQARASKEAVALLRSALAASPPIPALQLRKSFRIAMSTCVRDKTFSPHAFDHASRILDIMQTALADADVRTCTRYLDLAIGTDDMQTIGRALARLGPHVINVKGLLAHGSGEDVEKVKADEAKDAIALVKLMIACCDKLLQRGETGKEEGANYAMQRGKLAAFVTRWNREGGWRRGVVKGDTGVETGSWRVGRRKRFRRERKWTGEAGGDGGGDADVKRDVGREREREREAQGGGQWWRGLAATGG